MEGSVVLAVTRDKILARDSNRPQGNVRKPEMRNPEEFSEEREQSKVPEGAQQVIVRGSGVSFYRVRNEGPGTIVVVGAKQGDLELRALRTTDLEVDRNLVVRLKEGERLASVRYERLPANTIL